MESKTSNISIVCHWKAIKRHNNIGGSLFIGSFKIATYVFYTAGSREDPKKYQVVCNFNNFIGHYETQKEAIDKCQEIADEFIKALTNTNKSDV